ncbi:M14 family metallopeptidase [Vibrio rumoiensis]|uniref:Peptidase n=1 Tax=Vibrio rumoiensis 1S-45 TaxID=1188252 RepID=A0A1E5E2K2_9VIBR|nr:M14 family metallocarboxypeptidase [Vibrio rumoiensis]OEF25761.1 peptidase [Vibrio rumoiensis 1S-45]
MNVENAFPIGIPGQKWGATEKRQWLEQTTVKRSYFEEVVPKIEALKANFDVFQYGQLHYDNNPVGEDRYPLFALKTRSWSADKPTVLVTGGVHGYETSGVHGALLFAQSEAAHYQDAFNIVIAPCVSPWGYETINRWNPEALDPNRNFIANSPAQESAAVMQMVADLGMSILAHIDLHETTDTDELEFRPALAARDGIEYVKGSIPDGFYTVGDTEKEDDELQKAIIDSVRQVTHIAPADENNQIIGSDVTQEGVINYPLVQLGLCAGFTDCTYCTTTEVYPDSPKVTDDECNRAQVAAITGALDFIQRL